MLSVTFKRSSLVIIFVNCSLFGFSQSAKVKGIIRNVPDAKLFVIRPAYSFSINDVYMGFQRIELGDKGKFSLSFDLTQPEIMKAIFVNSKDSQLFYYNLYISPGDDLKMEKEGSISQSNFKVSGKGANNNQSLDILSNDDVNKFSADTLPGRVIAYLESENKAHKKILDEYIKKHKPSAGFITAWEANLQYEVLNDYYSFETNNAYRIGDAYERNYEKWYDTRSTLLQKAPLVNESALVASTYKQYLGTYLLRTKESLWNQFWKKRSDFLYEWYGKDTAAGASAYTDDQTNDLQQRIIEKNFTGKTKEYLYAVLINHSLADRDFKNIFMVYRQFKMQFPESKYLVLFEEQMRQVAARQENKLSAKMKFIDSAGLIKTWEDVLAYYKGKAVLLDMWGTWCGPCRQDLDRHSAFIKEYFKNKPLNYLYIANFDEEKEKLWRELIAYFHLEGDHILATEDLTNDIMKKVKGQGYPTYVILHKDGTFELYDRGFGLDREVLTAKLEAALAQ